LVEHSPGELGVLTAGHGFQMSDLAAQSVVAGVVEGRRGDRSDLPQVDQSVDELLAPLITASHDSVTSGVGSALPDEAPTLAADGVALQPFVIDDQPLGDVGAGVTSYGSLADGLPTVDTCHVVSVTPELVRATYDIGVEDAHEFTANGIVVHNCYRETSNPVDGWLDPSFIEQKKREIPAEMWRVEYELGEPSIGNRAFDSEKVEETFSLPAPTAEDTIKVGKDFEQYKFEEYRETDDYVISADWAQAQDFTVITVYKVTHLPIQRVYYMRMRRRPYPVMIEYFNRIMRAYNADAIHDATGLGNVVNDYLDTRARGFQMTGAKRDNMLSEYVNAVENGKVRSPRIESAYKATLYASVEDLYSRAKEFHLPDEVCADALAWHLCHARAFPVDPLVIPNSDDPNWMRREMETNRNNDRKSEWVIGRVTRKDEDAEAMELMV
jgi:hypothetical protein